MDTNLLKSELISWIENLNDKMTIHKIKIFKDSIEQKKANKDSKIYGSGKSLISFVADDFNEPLNIFKEYEK